MGGDSLQQLSTWERPREFVEVCDVIAVMRRPNNDVDLGALEHVLPGITAKTIFVNAPLIEISGEDIRRRVFEGRSFRYFVPNSVYHYILKQRLYKDFDSI